MEFLTIIKSSLGIKVHIYDLKVYRIFSFFIFNLGIAFMLLKNNFLIMWLRKIERLIVHILSQFHILNCVLLEAQFGRQFMQHIEII